MFTAGDEASYAAAVTAALAASRREADVVERLAHEYSWQAQEEKIRAYYARITGFEGRAAEDEFPSLDVVVASAG